MANHLKQATAVDVLIGPFVDITDGATAETGESPSVKLSKNGQTLAAKSDVTTPVHDADGYYNCELDATDTGTVGNLVLTVAASANALPVRHEFQVLEENVYDAIYGSSATLGTDITAIDTKLDDIQGPTFATGTDSLEAIRDRGDSAWTGSAPTSDSGTAQAGSSTTITLEAGYPATDNLLDGQVIFITAGTGAGQSKAIASYNGTTGVATIIGTWAVTPDNTSVYDIYPDDIDEITAAPTAAAVADAVWDENTTGHNIASTFGQRASVDIPAILADTNVIGSPAGATISADIAAIKTDSAAILVDTNELQVDWVDGGRLDLILDAIKSDSAAILIDTAEIGAAGAGLTVLATQASVDTIDSNVDAVLLDTAEIGAAGAGLTVLATQASVDTVDGNVDLIKAKTDQMTFTVANQLDANVESINAVTVLGAGTGGNLWRA